MTCQASDTPCLIAGDDFFYDVTYTEKDKVTPIDLTGATAKMELRDSVTSAVVEVTLSGGITNPTAGQMRFSLTDSQTATLLPREVAEKTLSSSIKITFSDATEQTILIVNLRVEQAATE